MRLAMALALFFTFAAEVSAAALRVAAFPSRPFLYQEKGRYEGLEYEMLHYFASAKKLDLQVVVVARFEDVLPAVERGEADVGAANLTITPERQRTHDWTVPYLPVRVVLVEPRPARTRSIEELAGVKVATVRGSTYERILSSVPGIRLVYGRDLTETFEMVDRGEATALACDSTLVLRNLQRFPRLELGIALSPEQGYGFAVRKGSPLAAELSHHIGSLKSSQIYFRLLTKYLGENALRIIRIGREGPAR